MKLKKLEQELEKLYEEVVEAEATADALAARVHKKYRLSARNLLHYLLLRQHDLRKIHDKLSDQGISSLRSSEGYVFDNLSKALRLVKLLQGKEWKEKSEVDRVTYSKSRKLLIKHANHLFGTNNKAHHTHIMVTMPDEAAYDLNFLRSLVIEGMEIARINLSHGDREQWEKMVANIRQVSEEIESPVQIYMDLAGPKIRTSQIAISRKKSRQIQVRDFIKVRPGEHIWLTKGDSKGEQFTYLEGRKITTLPEVGVSLPQIIDGLHVGDEVFFDDGKIEARVISKEEERVELLILKAHKSKLASFKGINLPHSSLDLPSLTSQDLDNLPFVVEHADILGYSFVRNAGDVSLLYEELDRLGADDVGVVFKIENREAFENLPLILLKAMERNAIGIMIARGDLAVEIGYERISEVQNEILWLSEAAHIPVIWATQVLENLAKKGLATRAEVSDAAVSVQAECVMLNKGPYIVDAVRTLKNILVKMYSHTSKKKSMMRPLKVAETNVKKIKTGKES